MKKNNPARRAGEKNNLAPILSEKNILARTKNPSPPLNIKWTVPKLGSLTGPIEAETRNSLSFCPSETVTPIPVGFEVTT